MGIGLIAWDSLRVNERRFEGVTIFREDPVEEIDREISI
jgi:hypothetical protein